MTRSNRGDAERERLKQDNERLKRQIARLRKDNEKLRNGEAVDEEETQEEVSKPICPKCSSPNLGEISTPNGKKIVSCRSCRKWRSKAS